MAAQSGQLQRHAGGSQAAPATEGAGAGPDFRADSDGTFFVETAPPDAASGTLSCFRYDFRGFRGTSPRSPVYPNGTGAPGTPPGCRDSPCSNR